MALGCSDTYFGGSGRNGHHDNKASELHCAIGTSGNVLIASACWMSVVVFSGRHYWRMARFVITLTFQVASEYSRGDEGSYPAGLGFSMIVVNFLLC